MAPRGRYNRYSIDVRERLLKVWADGGDWRRAAELFGVHRRTAFEWVANYSEGISQPRKRGGAKMKLLNGSEIEEILKWVSEDTTQTLELLRMRVKAEFNKEIGKSTLARYLDGELLTMMK